MLVRELELSQNQPKILKAPPKGVRRALTSEIFLVSEEENWDNGEEDDWTDDEWGEDEGWGEEEEW
jgi:hypothetical protein